MKSARLSALFLLLLSPAALAAQADAGAPFGMLTLVDEVDCGNPADPHRLHEDPVGGSQVKTVLGRPARTLSMDTSAKVFAYKLGVGKGLVAGKAYLLSVEYPEDTGRQLVIINRGAEYSRAVSTGQTIGDARQGYTYPAPESLKVPLSQKWVAHRTLFFLHDRFQGIKGTRDENGRVFEDTPQSGFWVIIGQFRQKDSPLDEGAAVARIRLFEVPNPDSLRSGLALVRHFNLNEEDGQNPAAQEGPLSKKVGYFATDVDRSGPYSMLAEARAVANGDPRFIGYLSSSSFNRGAPEYVRAFNAAYLALPALPSKRVDGASSDAEVVVRRIDTPKNGSYFAVVNTSLQAKQNVKVTLAGTGSLHDLVSGAWPPRTNQQLTLSFYPGQLYAFQLIPPAATLAGGNDEETLGTEVLDEAFVEDELPSGWE